MPSCCKLRHRPIMEQLWVIVLSYLIFARASLGHPTDLSFPGDFNIGAGSAAYQIEGAWNASDKSENIWDRWTHTKPESILDESNGDVAIDFYHKYKEDVQLIKSVGLKLFRFSIAWSRVLPTGFKNVISKEGLQFYKNLTAELVANGIEPVVTLHHFDHPQILEEYGGWTNELMVDWFVSYARIMFRELGDSVKIWTTINEPNIYCSLAYDFGGQFAPGKDLNSNGRYLCVHNMLKAHAKAYHVYDKEFRRTQKGQIGILPQCFSFLPANSSDTRSAEIAFQFQCGWVTNPIYKGDYPKIMKKRIAMVSKAQGYPKSRLPEFSKEWIATIKGTADYFGLNHYASGLVSPDPAEALGIYNADSGLVLSVDPSWPKMAMAQLTVNPSGFGDILRQIKNKYGNPPVRVMENGYADNGELDDFDRIQYHHDYLKELLTAVKRDGCNVKSYFMWTIMDNFEWNNGYVPRFGMFKVDFNDTERARTPKLSVSWWESVLRERKVQLVPQRNN